MAVIPAQPAIGGVLFWLAAIVGTWLTFAPATRHRAAPANLWWVVGLIYGIDCLSVFVFEQRFREAVWFPLLALPMIMPLARVAAFDERRLVWSAAAGCLLSLSWVLWVAWRATDLRASLGSNAILFGETTLALVMIVVVGRHVVARDLESGIHCHRRKMVLNLAALAGLTAVMVVGFRGALFTVPLFALALLGIGLKSKDRLVPSWVRVGIALVVLFAAIAFVGPRDGLLDRLLLVQSEVAGYASGKVGFSSLGSRLELWEAALKMFLAHPWFGVGVHRFNDELAILQTLGHFPTDVILFKHAHNSYLTVAAEFGVVGLTIFAVLLFVVVRRLREIASPAGPIGLYVLALWLIMAMTNDVLAHQTTMRAMVLVLAICLAAPRRARDEHLVAGEPPPPVPRG